MPMYIANSFRVHWSTSLPPRPPLTTSRCRRSARATVLPRTPLLQFALWIMLGLSLVALAVPVAPPRMLPASVGIVVRERRESLFYFGIAAALGIGVGFGIALLGS